MSDKPPLGDVLQDILLDIVEWLEYIPLRNCQESVYNICFFKPFNAAATCPCQVRRQGLTSIMRVRRVNAGEVEPARIIDHVRRVVYSRGDDSIWCFHFPREYLRGPRPTKSPSLSPRLSLNFDLPTQIFDTTMVPRRVAGKAVDMEHM